MLASVKKILIVFSMCSLVFSAGCSQSAEGRLNKFYGEDAQYFLGLRALQDNQIEKAKSHFKRCVKSGSEFPSRRSLEQLILFADIQERISLCRSLLEKYDDDAAKIFACREFIRDKEYALLIDATEKIDYAEAKNELCRMRLDALAAKKDSRLEDEIYQWFTTRRISAEHYDFYRKNAKDEFEEIILQQDINSDNTSQNSSNLLQISKKNSEFAINSNFIQQFRIAIYRGNYNAAFEMVGQVEDVAIKRHQVPLTYQLVADMGRACVNGSLDNIRNAKKFRELAENPFYSHKKEIKYYALLYSGLLYNKDDNYRRRALLQFEDAVQASASDEEYDQALWYYMQAALKISTDEAVNALQKYCASWHDADYFDDFFDSLSVLIFSSGKWDSFGKVYSLVRDSASAASVSKYAYLSGRMMDAGFVKKDEVQIREAYEAAASADCGTYVYYKLLAAKELGLTEEQIEAMIFGKEKNASAQDKRKDAKNSVDKTAAERALSARRLLLGYADFGFGERIYDEWLSFFEDDKFLIDLDTVVHLSSFLRKVPGNGNYSKSLRMISRSANLDGVQITREAFELLYPENFSSYVEASAKEFEVDKNVLYALIRTESFFDPQIQSHAGATGLTQLMEATAADCAKRLGVEDYDLSDPETNIRFGSYYFSNMVSRLNGSQILALFAYNAGITNVRRWVRSSKIELERNGSLESELFLETLPFAETRDYGRRVVSAAAMYAFLYEGKSPFEIVGGMM